MPERKDGTKRVMRYPGASGALLEYLRRNADVVIPYKEIMTALDMPAYTVSNAVNHLINRRITPLERPMKGMVIYHSGKVDYDLAKTMDAERPVIKPTFDAAENTLGQIEKELAGSGIAQYPQTVVAQYFDYVGKMEAYSIIRDNSDDLYVAIPLMAFLKRDI